MDILLLKFDWITDLAKNIKIKAKKVRRFGNPKVWFLESMITNYHIIHMPWTTS